MVLRWPLISQKWNLRRLISSGGASKVISFCFWLVSLFDWTIDPKKRITHIIDTLKIADYVAFPFGLARIEFWAKDMVLLGSYLVLSGLRC